MFSLGLEFSLRKLVRVGPTAGLTAVIQSSIMVWLGFVAGRPSAGRSLESLFAGAIIAISSTTIIAKAFDEQGIRGQLRELVVGVLIVEDLIAILLMAMLTAVSASGRDCPPATLALTLAAGWPRSSSRSSWSGCCVVPRAVRAIVRLGGPETTLVASIGSASPSRCSPSGLGYSVALGAFIAGSLVAESGEEAAHRDLVAAGAGHVRRHLLRLGGHADRPGADRRATGWRSWSSPPW